MDNDKTVSPEEEERTKSTITYMANEEIIKSTRGSIQLAHDKYMKPETYTGNRTLYDSDKAKRNAKIDIFEQNQRVIDPYTGERLVLTKKEAKMLYGEDWSKHLAESDHIKPLEKIYSDTKSNVWNTTGDIRTAANSKDNISVTSRKFNNPKRSRTQQEYLYDEKYLQNKGVNLTEDGKKRALMDAEQAEKSINSQLKKRTVENICKTGHEAGMNSGKAAGETAVIISGLMNIADVVNGEKEVDEAVYDVLKTGGESVVVGYAMGSTMTILGHSLEDSSSDIIQALLGSNVPTKIITAVQVMGGTIKKFATGDIELNECIEELGKDGVNFPADGYASVIGQELIPIPVLGAAIGAFVGTLITGKSYEFFLNVLI